jgi:N-methylhydantoinase A
MSIIREIEDVTVLAATELGAFGFDEASLELLHRADVRYQGQDDTITVPVDRSWLADEEVFLRGVRRAFVEMHRQLYGYGDEDAPLEVVTTRCRTIARVPHPSLREWTVDEPAEPRTCRPVYFQIAGGFVDTPVFDRESLANDQVIPGPTIVEEWTTTTVIPPDWSLRTERSGNLILTLAKEGE